MTLVIPTLVTPGRQRSQSQTGAARPTDRRRSMAHYAELGKLCFKTLKSSYQLPSGYRKLRERINDGDDFIEVEIFKGWSATRSREPKRKRSKA